MPQLAARDFGDLRQDCRSLWCHDDCLVGQQVCDLCQGRDIGGAGADDVAEPIQSNSVAVESVVLGSADDRLRDGPAGDLSGSEDGCTALFGTVFREFTQNHRLTDQVG